MYVLIVSIVCALMLGGVHFATYESGVEAVLVAFLLFVAIDTGLRSIMDKPSWILRIMKRKR